MFTKEKSISQHNSKEIDSIIGEGTNFKGILSFDGSIRIDGNMEGQINSNGTLFVGDKAVIQADIKIDTIIVEGNISGNIIAKCRLVILSGAEVYGNIKTPVFKIEEGAKFQGSCDMGLETKETKSISWNKSNIINKTELQDIPPPLKEVA